MTTLVWVLGMGVAVGGWCSDSVGFARRQYWPSALTNFRWQRNCGWVRSQFSWWWSDYNATAGL